MENNVITSDPPATTPKSKKSKMSAAGRKAVSEAAKARWAARKAETPLPPVLNVPPTPLPPSPAVLQLQAQVVDMVSQRGEARSRLTEAHAVYLLAQSRVPGR